MNKKFFKRVLAGMAIMVAATSVVIASEDEGGGIQQESFEETFAKVVKDPAVLENAIRLFTSPNLGTGTENELLATKDFCGNLFNRYGLRLDCLEEKKGYTITTGLGSFECLAANLSCLTFVKDVLEALISTSEIQEKIKANDSLEELNNIIEDIISKADYVQACRSAAILYRLNRLLSLIEKGSSIEERKTFSHFERIFVG